MMRSSVCALLLLATAACDAGKPGGRVSVNVNALTGELGKACYHLEARNAAGATLWAQDLCSDRYGNGPGGDLSYVGACDANSNANSLRVILTDLYDASGAVIPATSYDNPCPAGAACTQAFTCRANEDTSLLFNLTVLLKAQIGFVDVGVNLDTLNCSAKLDCSQGGLTDPKTGDTVASAVVAFACQAPAGTAQFAYMNDVALECRIDNAPQAILINPAAGPGNLFNAESPAPDGLIQAATYFSQSTIDADGKSFDQLSWAIAIAPDLAALTRQGYTDCRVVARATASRNPFALVQGQYQTPLGQAYPLVVYSVTVATAVQGALAFGCANNPLGGDGSGVVVQHASADKGETLSHQLATAK